MRYPASLMVVLTGCLLVGGALETGCGNLRGSLGDAGATKGTGGRALTDAGVGGLGGGPRTGGAGGTIGGGAGGSTGGMPGSGTGGMPGSGTGGMPGSGTGGMGGGGTGGTVSGGAGGTAAGNGSGGRVSTGGTSGVDAATDSRDAGASDSRIDVIGADTNAGANGVTCKADSECVSGHCVDGRCCNVDCTAQCGSCMEVGSLGTCITVVGAPRSVGAPARAACAGVGVCQSQCNGDMPTCQFPTSSIACGNPASCAAGTVTSAGKCNAGTCVQAPMTCGSGYCDPTTKSCAACNTEADCGVGKWCNAGTCEGKKANGSACGAIGSSSECTSGVCVAGINGAGVCCATACGSAATPRCNAAGTACVCTSSPTNSCPGTQVCNQGACCLPKVCDGCRTLECDPGCGLAVLASNCGFTSSGCCGSGPSGFCCAGYGVCCASQCLPMGSTCF